MSTGSLRLLPIVNSEVLSQCGSWYSDADKHLVNRKAEIVLVMKLTKSSEAQSSGVPTACKSTPLTPHPAVDDIHQQRANTL